VDDAATEKNETCSKQGMLWLSRYDWDQVLRQFKLDDSDRITPWLESLHRRGSPSH